MRRTFRLLVGLLAVLAFAPSAAQAVDFGLSRFPVLAPSVQPDHFRHTAGEVAAIARRSPGGQRLLGRVPDAVVRVRAPDMGLWIVTVERGDRVLGSVEIEDRTGGVLEHGGAWSWPQTGSPMSSFKRTIELILLGLSLLFVAGMVDRRRLRSWRTLDALALTAGFGVAFACFDRQQVLWAIPLTVPVLGYLLARMLALGLRGARDEQPWAPPPLRLLLVGLVALVGLRISYNLLEGAVNDVGYASVVGADSIIHGWPLYTADDNHLDTYGPIAYLAYVPATLLFPMNDGWLRDGLPAAHATSIAVDLLTLGLLVLLGRRLRPGRDGTHLGVALAFLFAACPWTFLGMAIGSNDGLVGLLLVATLLALRSPAGRGAVVGLAAAAKFSPVALLPLIAAGGGLRPRAAVKALVAFGAVVLVAFLAYLPDGGVRELWDATLGFQLQRRSFHSIWGQYPQLEPLQALLKAAVVGLVLAVAVIPRRRDVAQVAALAAVIIIGLQLVVQYWTFVYVGWFLPLVIVALAVREDRVPVEVEAPQPAPAARPVPAVA